jgi:hypothetical protein
VITRCSNPDCAAHYEYRTGRLFRFRHSKGEGPENTHSAQHFWLCKICSESFTLECRKGQAVLIPINAYRHASLNERHAHN